mgnify:CR=1 FL=1
MKEIAILGTGCKKCNTLFELTEKAASELGLECQISKVTELDKIMTFGVMITPALVIDGEIKVQGKLPKYEALKNLLTEST